jgi:hypothetical protein
MIRHAWRRLGPGRLAGPPALGPFRRYMVPGLQLVLVLDHGARRVPGVVALLARFLARGDVTHLVTLLPELPRSVVWELELRAARAAQDGAGLSLLPVETGRWMWSQSVEWGYFRFWTDAEMGFFEASFEARVQQFRPGMKDRLYSGECEDYVHFVQALTPTAPPDVGAAGNDTVMATADNPFDSFSDRHFLFEIRHFWRFVFADQVAISFAHVRGHEVWSFLDRNVSGQQQEEEEGDPEKREQEAGTKGPG